ncbi:MAG: hypothetical protein ACR2KS_02735 [Candidatus Eremiobacter antarcticus]|nr:hypothetical protein [Candidatus Eremiobacteraeota bacterium]
MPDNDLMVRTITKEIKGNNVPPAPKGPKSHKLSLNVSPETGRRLRRLAFEQRLSESSIVETALRLFFARGDDEELGSVLRELGASLRRK